MPILFQLLQIPYNITKLPESGVLCDNITEFGVIFRHLKQSDIATQHTRRRSLSSDGWGVS